jgi:hypothetical protein
VDEIVILDKDYALVTFIRKYKLGKIIWRRKPLTSEYRNSFHKLLDYTQVEPVEYFFSDMTNQGVISHDDREWFANQMLPMAIKAGLKRAAVLLDGNVIKTYYMNLLIVTSSRFGLPLRVFNNEEKAMEWLLGIKKPEIE